MNIPSLREQVGRYLKEYLPRFAEEGMEQDSHWMVQGNSVPYEQVLRYFGGEAEHVDLHRARFQEISRQIPSASLSGFVHRAANLQDVVVVDVGSHFGQEFSLWIARMNEGADVHLYDPEPLPVTSGNDHGGFPASLFNSHNGHRLSKLKRHGCTYTPSRQEESINQLFDVNVIARRGGSRPNVTYHQQALSEDNLDALVRNAGRRGKRVLLYSRRTPQLPEEMSSRMAKVARTYENTDLLLLPHVNAPINAYSDDEVIRLINQYRPNRNMPATEATSPDATARSRLFTMCNLYLSLKAAELAGAQVYAETEFGLGFPYHHPTHFVSTLEPSV